MAGYLKALGDSTSDATAIDLDVGVSSQPADEDSVFRVQESADGTSFVLEFSLDADDTGAIMECDDWLFKGCMEYYGQHVLLHADTAVAEGAGMCLYRATDSGPLSQPLPPCCHMSVMTHGLLLHG